MRAVNRATQQGILMRRILFGVLFVTATMGLAGCDEPLTKIAGPTPDLQPTFTSTQPDFFEAADSAGRRNCPACHSSVGRTPAAGMSLDHDVAYDSIVRASSNRKPGAVRVRPG